MLLRGCVDRDPLTMLYELLDSHSIVKNANPAVNFEDKYILKFYKRIKSYAGRVEGELTLNIPRDLRPLVSKIESLINYLYIWFKKQNPYLSALYFWHSLVELDSFLILKYLIWNSENLVYFKPEIL